MYALCIKRNNNAHRVSSDEIGFLFAMDGWITRLHYFSTTRCTHERGFFHRFYEVFSPPRPTATGPFTMSAVLLPYKW